MLLSILFVSLEAGAAPGADDPDSLVWAQDLAELRVATVDPNLWRPAFDAEKDLGPEPFPEEFEGFPGDVEIADTRDSLDALVDSCRPGPGKDATTCWLTPDESMDYDFGDFDVAFYRIEFTGREGFASLVTPVSEGIEDCEDAARAKAATVAEMASRFSGQGAKVERGPRFGTSSCSDLLVSGPGRWTVRSAEWEGTVDTSWNRGEFRVEAAYRRLARSAGRPDSDR